MRLNSKIIIFSLCSLSLYGTTFSYSEMNIPLSSIPTLISTNMNIEINAIRRLDLFYENNITKENERKEKNVQKLIRLNTKESLLMGEIISLDKKIQKVLEMDKE